MGRGPKLRRFSQLQQWLKLLAVALGAGLLAIWSHPSATAEGEFASGVDQQIIQALPLQPHPLPPSLVRLANPDNPHSPDEQGDYFAQVKPTEVGYLLWNQFPVKVYLEPTASPSQSYNRAWRQAVTQVVNEWSLYLPLQIIQGPHQADITILQSSPKVQAGRVRSAETRYELFVTPEGTLGHRCTVFIRPRQTTKYTQASVRHELGHALGIWGHSAQETDALYFSQVRNPPAISARDVNTLKRVYRQPTRLGWQVPLDLQQAGLDFNQNLNQNAR